MLEDNGYITLARDLESFGEITREVLQRLPGVKEIYSSFSYKAVKERRVIPVSEKHI